MYSLEAYIILWLYEHDDYYHILEGERGHTMQRNPIQELSSLLLTQVLEH